MVMVNQDGVIEMVNAQAERVFGYARAELLGRPVDMLVPERFRDITPACAGRSSTIPGRGRWARVATFTP